VGLQEKVGNKAACQLRAVHRSGCVELGQCCVGMPNACDAFAPMFSQCGDFESYTIPTYLLDLQKNSCSMESSVSVTIRSTLNHHVHQSSISYSGYIVAERKAVEVSLKYGYVGDNIRHYVLIYNRN
jgi:hypothetical protein